MNQNVIAIKDRNDFVVGDSLPKEKTMKDWEKALKDSSIGYIHKPNNQLFAELKKNSAKGGKVMKLLIYNNEQKNEIVANITHEEGDQSNEGSIGIDPQKAINEFLSFKPCFMEENFGA